MKTYLRLLPFMVCLALTSARAADQTPAPVDKPALDMPSDLPKSTDPLIDPLTGTPYIAVHNGDIVESVIFIIEFQHAHPKEHAVLLMGKIEKDLSGKLDPAAAFSWDGKVYLHSRVIGNVLIPDVSPEQINGSERRLHEAYINLIRYYYEKSFEKMHVSFPLPDDEAYRMGKADLFPHVLPNELPGDTEDIQARRIEARLKQLGLTSVKAYFNVTDKDKYGKPIVFDGLNFDFENFAYAWTPRGCDYIGLAGKTYLPSMLDSIIFSIDYQKANPSEKVFCFLHEASGKGHMPGLTVAATVFTKQGQLWFHHLVPADLPSPLSLDDLKDSDKVIAADLAVYAPAIKQFDAQEAHLRYQPPSGLKKYLHGYKAPDLSVAGVLAELQKRGVEAKITDDTDKPELLFVWGKRPYTYKPGLGCFAGKPVQATASN